MDTTLDLDVLHYVPCDNDPGWVRCGYCSQKVYIGSGTNLIDLTRHENRCPWRD